VLLGSTLGLVFRARLPERIAGTVFQAIGIFTLYVGVQMAMRTGNLVIMVLSVVVGAVIGEWLTLERRLDALAEGLKARFAGQDASFVEGFITATLLFCTGSMAILGALEEGLGGAPNLLLAKSVLDGFSSLALAAGLGLGVAFAAVPVLIYQGGIALLAGVVEPILSETLIAEMTAVGGLLLVGLGIDILGLKKIRVTNMLPSLLVAVTFAAIWP
jgi:hypothetical protein